MGLFSWLLGSAVLCLQMAMATTQVASFKANQTGSYPFCKRTDRRATSYIKKEKAKDGHNSTVESALAGHIPNERDYKPVTWFYCAYSLGLHE